MILSEAKQALVNTVKARPGSSSWEVAERVGIDPANACRDLKQLCRDGFLSGQQDQGGRRTIRFWPADQSPIGYTSTPADEPVDFQTYQRARITQREQAASDSFGRTEIVGYVENRKLDIPLVKPRIRPARFSDLLSYEKYIATERDKRAAPNSSAGLSQAAPRYG